MRNSIFRFKQFEIDQKGSAMKINTDGVLLAAISEHLELPDRILDVGTGTGVIALMLAQRYPSAKIDAVEIDAGAAQSAAKNFGNSIFTDRLKLINGSFDMIKQKDVYDWIISNPPFYTSSLHNPDERRRIAKHTDITFFKNLVQFAEGAMTARGELHLILPPSLADEVIALADTAAMTLIQTVSIRSFETSATIRQIIRLQKGAVSVKENSDFVIYAEKGKYSEGYRRLLQPFFLTF